MLKPAQLYEEELQEKYISSWYQKENFFWSGGLGNNKLELPDNNYNSHCFASVDEFGCVIGYISYSIDWAAMSAYYLAIISFQKGNITFVKDVCKAIWDIFNVYHMNRLSWFCYADNPAIRGYRNFIKKCGGRECGYYRQDTKLQDGRLHDSVCFEVLAEEFIQNCSYIHRQFISGGQT